MTSTFLTIGLSGMDWGSVPAWVSTASVLIAALTYWHSQRDKRREYASKIAAWISESSDGDEQKFALHVENFGDTPVYHLTIMDADRYVLAEYPELQPKQADEQAIYPKVAAFLGAFRAIAVLESSLLRDEDVVAEIERFLKEEPVQIHFRDALGRYWARGLKGKIKPTNKQTGALSSSDASVRFEAAAQRLSATIRQR
ncbi:hypothetical protein [Kitasatospora azatica]|uniref:hypothetical protein n=1 Tax=Kitasatospora azatica TaxID=58347 RepID=UPI0018DDE011|nr:hypothetical protein [Kitasatospora azatica]